VLSCALDSKCVTTASHAARIHECSLRVLQQLFNYCFRFVSVHDFGVDHVKRRVISSHHTTVAKIRREFMRRRVVFTRLRVHEHRPAFGIGTTRWNCRVWKKDHAFAGLSETQTMPARKTAWGVCNHDSMVWRSIRSGSPRCVCNLGRKRSNAKFQSFHDRS